jgi:hypothetical protein
MRIIKPCVLASWAGEQPPLGGEPMPTEPRVRCRPGPRGSRPHERPRPPARDRLVAHPTGQQCAQAHSDRAQAAQVLERGCAVSCEKPCGFTPAAWSDVLAVYLLGGDGCCTFYEKRRLGALLCLVSSSSLTGYRFPMPRAKEPRAAWPWHCERHLEPIKASGSVGAAR